MMPLGKAGRGFGDATASGSPPPEPQRHGKKIPREEPPGTLNTFPIALGVTKSPPFRGTTQKPA
jgi:hypothetical protein